MSLSAVAATPEGRQVIRGLFWLYSTHGVPLPDAITYCCARGTCPDWMDLLAEMINEGKMKPDKALRVLESAIMDSALMPTTKDEIVRRLLLCASAP